MSVGSDRAEGSVSLTSGWHIKIAVKFYNVFIIIVLPLQLVGKYSFTAKNSLTMQEEMMA